MVAMSENLFEGRRATPESHFTLYFYAAVLRLLEQLSDPFDSWEEVLKQFPFLAGYIQELARSGVEGMTHGKAYPAVWLRLRDTECWRGPGAGKRPSGSRSRRNGIRGRCSAASSMSSSNRPKRIPILAVSPAISIWIETPQGIPHLLDDPAPITRLGLPEKTHRRVPRAIGAADHPAPVGIVLQENPNRTSQRSRQVRRHRVHGN